MRSHAQATPAGSTFEWAGRPLLVSALLGAMALALLAFAPAASAKSLDAYIPDAAGPGVAVNEASGDIYVSQPARVMRFAADGTLERIWGKDVVAGNEATGYEICVAASEECKQGVAGQLKGEFIAGSSGGGIAIDQSDGSVYVWDARSGNGPSSENLRVQKFDADGNFVLMFGKEVNADTGEDVCTEASGDLCQAGLETAEPGGFGNPSINVPGLAVSPIDGDVFAADPLNNRIQRFEADGAFVEEIGSAAQFAARQPRAVAIDSQGVLYASDSDPAGQSEIRRYDAYGAHGAPAFLAPIAVPPLLAVSTGGFESSPSTSLEVDLDSEGDGAAGTDTDVLYVLRNPSEGETVVQQFDSPGEAAAPGTVAETHGVGDGFSTTGGLGLNPLSGDLYIAASGNLFILRDGGDGIAPVSASIGGVSDVGPHQADVEGLVDPGGSPARYRFEYAPEGGEFTQLPLKTVNGEGDQPVTETLTGLLPNSDYRVRLYAENVTGPGEVSSTQTEELTFTTDAIPPTAATLAPGSFTDGDAWLAGTVNPNNLPTTYRFEWGETAAYGNQVPATDGDAGAGIAERGVLARIEGLQPETTYHYRLVTENAEGTTATADRTFTTRPAFTGFPERGYEQISPAQKNGANLGGEPGEGFEGRTHGNVPAVAADGSAASFVSDDVIADGDWIRNPTGGKMHFQARRNPTGEGWTTRQVVPRPVGFAGGNFGSAIAVPSFYVGRGDEGAAIDAPLVDEREPEGSASGGWVRDLISREIDSAYKSAGASDAEEALIGVAEDLSSVVFESREVWTTDPGLTPEGLKVYESLMPSHPDADQIDENQHVYVENAVGGTFTLSFEGESTAPIAFDTSAAALQAALEALPNLAPGDVLAYLKSVTNDGNRFWGVEFTGSRAGEDVGQMSADPSGLTTASAIAPPPRAHVFTQPPIRLVSVDGSGEPFADAVAGRGNRNGLSSHGFAIVRSAVSDDGDHIIFTTVPTSDGVPDDAAKIYRRSDGTTTTLVSPSQRSAPDPQGERGKEFAAATEDADRVFFISAEQLTDDANTGPERAGADLYRYEASTDTLIDLSASSLEANGARVHGLIGISEDGSTAYFVAKGRLVEGKGTPGANNVYRWREGEGVRYVTTLGPDAQDGDNFPIDMGRQETEQTARVSADGETLLLQSSASLTGYDNNGHSQLYLYEAGAHGGAGGLSCVSCRPDGAPASGEARVPTTGPGSDGGDTLARVLSADGSRVFFEAEDALLGADTNEVRDVYAWEAGRLALISTGKGEYGSAFHGASADGSDVFFITRQKLVGQDFDDLKDIYDARIGGGIAAQHPAPPGEPCVGDSCKPDVSEPPSPASPPSRGLAGPGNVVPALGCGRFGRRAVSLAKRTKRARRNARRLASNGKRRRAKQIHRRAGRLGKQARRLSKGGKRCRVAQRQRRGQ